jgi:hypothetical protein
MIDQTKKLMFIHIPKTAGTSVLNVLEPKFNWNQLHPEKWVPLVKEHLGVRHDPLFLLEKINDLNDYYKFCVVRNPYLRAFSLYKHYMHRAGKENRHHRKVYKNYVEFLKDILIIKDVYDPEVFFRQRPRFHEFMHQTQTFYIKNSKNEIGVDKIYHHEKIKQFESDFAVKLPILNARIYVAGEYYKENTVEAIDLVQKIYYEDFVNFNYSLNFI